MAAETFDAEKLAVDEWAHTPRSVSQVQEFEACAYRGFLKRVRKTEPRPAAWTTQGTAFHSAVEAFEKSGRTMTAEETVRAFQDAYSDRINRDLGLWPDLDLWLRAGRVTAEQDVESRYDQGCEQTRRYVDFVHKTSPVLWHSTAGAAVELPFETVFGTVPVRGIIDQVVAEPDGSLRVRDLKTGSTRSKFQLWVYGLALQQLHPQQRVSGGDWYLARDHRLSATIPLSEADVPQIVDRIVGMDRAVKAGSFPPNPGRGCRFCEVSHECDFFNPAG